MNILGFHHLALQVRDVERVASFYVQTLGLPELRRFHRDDGSLRSIWVGTTSGASGERDFLAIEAAPTDVPDGVLGFSMVALRIDPGQRAAVAAELARAGVHIEKETGWTLYLRDPEGNRVGLSHHPADAA